jgi:hypothetical protein
MRIQEKDIVVEGRLLKTVRLDEEWYEDLTNPEAFLQALRANDVNADLLTFWQRFPNSTPKFDYPVEWEDLAVLPVRTFNEWWDSRIKSRTRGLIRKSEKMGITVRETQFDDDFVRGMVEIFNEAPVRQGRPFWHYGKDFETVKREFSRFLFREDMIGAYYQGELIGFVMLANAGEYAYLGQIISKIAHRDKAPNNALIAKAVEVTARKHIPYLIYNYWNETGLTEFKRRNGFEKQSVPRYYLPLTTRGRVGLRLGAHRQLGQILPKTLVSRLKQLRSSFYARRYGATPDNA